MSIQESDDQFAKAVDYAAELIRDNGPRFFYRAINQAARSYDQDWHEIQQALAERSATVRHNRAASDPVKNIKALCKDFRRQQKEQRKESKKPKLQQQLF